MGLGLPISKWLHFAILSTFYKYKFITSAGFLITADSPYVSPSLCCCSAFFKVPLSTFFLSSLCSCAFVFSFQLFYYHMVVMKYCLPHFLFQCLAIFFQLLLSDLLNKRKKKHHLACSFSHYTAIQHICLFRHCYQPTLSCSYIFPHHTFTHFPSVSLFKLFISCLQYHCHFIFDVFYPLLSPFVKSQSVCIFEHEIDAFVFSPLLKCQCATILCHVT